MFKLYFIAFLWYDNRMNPSLFNARHNINCTIYVSPSIRNANIWYKHNHLHFKCNCCSGSPLKLMSIQKKSQFFCTSENVNFIRVFFVPSWKSHFFNCFTWVFTFICVCTEKLEFDSVTMAIFSKVLLYYTLYSFLLWKGNWAKRGEKD